MKLSSFCLFVIVVLSAILSHPDWLFASTIIKERLPLSADGDLVDGQSPSAVSFTKSAITSESLTVPTLNKPLNQAARCPVEYLEFEWSSVSVPAGVKVRYDLYLGDTRNPVLFREDLYDGWVSDDGMEIASDITYDNSNYLLLYLNFNTALQNETTYYWKVVAKFSTGENNESETFSFTTARYNTLPTAPSIISPVNNSIDVNSSVTLHWAPSTDVDGDPVAYDLYFGSNSVNTNSQARIATGLTDNFFTIPYRLEEQGSYYWKVYAIDGYSGEMVSSDESPGFAKFTIANTLNNAPVFGELLTPLNEASNTTFDVQFKWSPAIDKDNDAVFYDVYADTNTNPQTCIAFNVTSSLLTHRLNSYGLHFWKVVAKDSNGHADTSDIHSFSTWDIAPDFMPEMVNVEGGSFIMGQSELLSINDPYFVSLADEWPAHPVMLDDYQIAKFEVTNSQYVKFLNAIVRSTSFNASIRAHRLFGFYYRNVTFGGRDLCQVFDLLETNRAVGYEESYDSPIIWDGSHFIVDPKFVNHPVRFMYAYGAQLYSQWVGNFRLPTEAEWEYAAMGGMLSQGFTFSGSNDFRDVAVQNVNGPIDATVFTKSVGSLMPNELGIYDMSGNVEEICVDCYSSNFYSLTEASGHNPINKTCSGLQKVIRGGDFTSPISTYLRVKSRDYLGYAQQINNAGIRLVGSPPSKMATIKGCVIDQYGNPLTGVALDGFSDDADSGLAGCFEVVEQVGWSGKIYPKADGMEFRPGYIEITQLCTDTENLNFVALPTGFSYSLSGVVNSIDGMPLSNAVINNGQASTDTDMSGVFSFIMPDKWGGTISPQMEGYRFIPENIDIKELSCNISNLNFIALTSDNFYTIYGLITDVNGTPMPNIEIQGVSKPVFTSSNGTFYLNVATNWSGIIMPQSETHVFEPASVSISAMQADKNVLFTASSTTSASEQLTEDDCMVTVLPNPSKDGTIQIEYSGNGNAFIKVFNVLGNEICRGEMVNSYQMHLQNRGLYVLYIQTETCTITKKVMVLK